MPKAYILDAVRTPRGRGKMGKGSLSQIHPQELLAQTLDQLAARTHLDKHDVDDVVVGCVTQIGEQGGNVARNALLVSGWPIEVSAVTLNRYCGSGLQAVNFAAMGVMSGAQQLTVGGGVETMSRIAMLSDDPDGVGGYALLRERHYPLPQGVCADLIATLEGFSREDVDRFALESQRKAGIAQQNCYFSRSLFPVKDPRTGETVLTKDEHLRPETTMEALSTLKPAFAEAGASASPGGKTLDEIAVERYPQAGQIRHVHTAGNSSGIVDGAAAVLIASEEYVSERGLKPRAIVKTVATAAADPLIMLTAPTPASERALKNVGMSIGDIDLFEINEAFAVVPMQTMRNLNIDPAKVNVNGGSIALGHPLGATGAILVGTALDELERRNLSTALITLCIRGGQGIATIIERV